MMFCSSPSTQISTNNILMKTQPKLNIKIFLLLKGKSKKTSSKNSLNSSKEGTQ